jgi:hypothetical protein
MLLITDWPKDSHPCQKGQYVQNWGCVKDYMKQIFISQNVVWDIILPKQSCIVVGIKTLHQEINKHLILSDSVNQIESYWLLLLFMQTMQHEDRGMIFNTACPAMDSKVLKAFSTVNLLTEMQMFSE